MFNRKDTFFSLSLSLVVGCIVINNSVKILHIVVPLKNKKKKEGK
jgi:hypothetical protein